MNEQILHFWQSLATVSIGIIVTLIGFWVSIGKKVVTKEEITKMIQNETPYCKDREFIMERLATNKETQMALSITLQKVIEVMNELKVQIATLGKTLEALEERIERKT
jgi:predicted RND superfamily exporter protein